MNLILTGKSKAFNCSGSGDERRNCSCRAAELGVRLSCARKRLDGDNGFPQVFRTDESERKLCSIARALEASIPLLDSRRLQEAVHLGLLDH